MNSLQTLDTQDFTNFDLLEQPVWIFDRQSLRLLAVNTAACHWLGYLEEELLALTIADLRPAADQDKIRDEVSKVAGNHHRAGQWQLLKKDQSTVEATFSWRVVDFAGNEAILACIKDVTVETEMRASNQDLQRRERKRLANYRRVFEALPGKFAILAPQTYEVLAASDAFLELTTFDRETISGQNLFDVFPEEKFDASEGHEKALRASLQWVESFRLTDTVAVQRYLVKQSEGRSEERYWSLINSPVMDENGTLLYLVHRIENLTALYQAVDGDPEQSEIGHQDSQLVQGALLRANEIRNALHKAQEQNVRLRTAENLLDLGAWDYDIENGVLNWSPEVYRIYGVSVGRPMDFDAYAAMIHPEDRDQTLATYQAFMKGGQDQLVFAHRVITEDESVKHIRGVGERHQVKRREMVLGYVQDITKIVALYDDYNTSQQLLRMAGEKVRLGGWKLDLRSDELIWTPETAAIHELPPDTSPTVEEAINYYAPEYRGQIEQAVSACIESGTEIDEILQLVTARGNRIWVRSIGMAVRDASDQIIAIQGAFQDISALIEARSAASEFERQRLDILEKMREGFVTLDQDWCFTYLNRQAEHLIGCQREEITGKSFWAVFPELQGSAFARELRAANEAAQLHKFEEFFAPRECWFEVSAHSFDDGVAGLALYFSDTSEKRSRQQQLAMLESAVENLTDIVLIADAGEIDAPHGPRIIYTNQAISKVTGYSPAEIIGKTPRILQGEKTSRARLDRIRQSLEAGEAVETELINYKKSGEEFWVNLTINPVFDSRGEINQFVAIQRDISANKEADSARRQSEERFSRIAKATSDVIMDWDLNNNKIWWSNGLRTVFGHDPKQVELRSESWINKVVPGDRDRLLDAINKVIAGDEQSWEEEYSVIKGSGDLASVRGKGFVIRNENGDAERMLASMVDMSKERELEQQITESRKLEAIGQLTGGVAHDFNNLLTVILGNGEELVERLKDSSERDLAQMVVSASERAAELTKRLLAFARRQVLRPKVVDVKNHLASMEPLLKRTLGEDIDILTTVVDEPDLIEVDPGQLEVAILNLAINARHAMPEGGKLTIETANVVLDAEYIGSSDVKSGDYVCISVSDNGCGMSPEVAKRAVEPFFTTKESGQGSGLGLSMVYGFAKQSQGNMKVYSEQGQGTTVKLYFPVVIQGSSTGVEAASVQHEPQGSEKILIVEDDDLVRKHLKSVLEYLGYSVTQAPDGNEALELLADGQEIDLLLTDVVLPGGLSGPEIAEKVVALNPAIKILYTSGYPETAIKRDGRLAASGELLGKPYRRRDVAQLVRKVLDS